MVTLKGIYVDEGKKATPESIKEWEDNFLEVVYQWYMANQGQGEFVKRHQRKEGQD